MVNLQNRYSKDLDLLPCFLPHLTTNAVCPTKVLAQAIQTMGKAVNSGVGVTKTMQETEKVTAKEVPKRVRFLGIISGRVVDTSNGLVLRVTIFIIILVIL
jgi:hypothetical protein